MARAGQPMRRLDEDGEREAVADRLAHGLAGCRPADGITCTPRACDDNAGGTTQERKRLAPLLLGEVQGPQVAENASNVRMVGTECLLEDGQGAPEQRLGVGVPRAPRTVARVIRAELVN